MSTQTTRREPFDEWLHRYEPLRGRARMWHFIKRFTGAIFGLIAGLLVLATLGVGALIITGVLMVLFIGWL